MGAARTVLAGLAAWRGAATDPAARAARLALEAIDAYGAVAFTLPVVILQSTFVD